ncbi:MAG: hypothetical protein QM796_21290 [Chthoniobacteraceae bacterium]
MFTTYNTNAAAQNAIWSIRPDNYNGFVGAPLSSTFGFYQPGMGTTNNSTHFRPGLLSQNNANVKTGGWATNGGVGQGSSGTQCYYTDADGVVRRGMAAYLQPSSTDAGVVPPSGAATGDPQAVATTYSTLGVGTPISAQTPSRPMILNRPFRSVAELGYASSGMPWRNLDFTTPECGYSGLLDVFCINDSQTSDSVIAGKVDLNTGKPRFFRQSFRGA